ncbi:MAG: c-type cytochrome [Gemmatimonadota bacterium]
MKRQLPILAVAAAMSAGTFGLGRQPVIPALTVRDRVALNPAGLVTRVSPDADRTGPARPLTNSLQSATPAQSSPLVALGERLFVSYNCGDCHGAGGGGAMAPSLQDNRWHFGGSQDEVFRSIAEGRPGGMPTWGAIIPGPEMIALTAYVRSLGSGKDLTTEDFTGITVERSGH